MTPPEPRFEHEIADDELRLLFVCADETIAPESQLVLALKILCGFSAREIALRLLTSEENVQKRLTRGRARLRELGPSLETPPPSALQARHGSVLRMIYLLFNEGYSSKCWSASSPRHCTPSTAPSRWRSGKAPRPA